MVGLHRSTVIIANIKTIVIDRVPAMKRAMDLFASSTIKLRDYQQESVSQALKALQLGHKPVIVLPTGAGKSIVIAEICRLKNILEQKHVLVIASRKELVKQNADKIMQLSGVDVGIYSAGMGIKKLSPITVGNIQSLYRQKETLNFDIIIVDEAHEINHEADGMYRTMLDEMHRRNEKLEIVGLTATPYRFGHGLITDEPALFNALIQCASVKTLQAKGYLSPIITKAPKTRIDVNGVHTRGGEFVESELQAKIETFDDDSAVAEIISRSEGRKSWLIFATGVKHAIKINSILVKYGIKSAVVYGDLGSSERDLAIANFKSGHLTALVNANILTTGFDNPNIDLIALLRPTMSRGLFVQMVGRGFRIAPGKQNCLVMDFAGNFARHGFDFDILKIDKTVRASDVGGGECLTKICPACHAMVPIQTRVCPECGYEKPKYWTLWDGTEIVEQEEKTFSIYLEESRWFFDMSKNGHTMLVFEGIGADGRIRDYFSIFHPNPAVVRMSMQRLKGICRDADVAIGDDFGIDDLNKTVKPYKLTYKIDNGFKKVTGYAFDSIPF